MVRKKQQIMWLKTKWFRQIDKRKESLNGCWGRGGGRRERERIEKSKEMRLD